LLENAFLQLPVADLTHRIRQQAGSYRSHESIAYAITSEGGLTGLLVLAQRSYAATSYSVSTSTSPLTSA
jgi:hypothetical protein